MRNLPVAYHALVDIDARQQPRLQRTAAERARLHERHKSRRQVYVKVMVRDHALTELQAEQRYDRMWGLV